ncbi:RNA 3'-phosphate cyclase [Candidatus Bathyarchaeota archaeon]|nr:RNA 3'-phosphate cyclase [Candidatus Bathyarchaeota archaeon]
MDDIHIDGSHGEGGGSILRLSAALATIYKKKLHVTNIRANRKVSGLRQQHVMGLKALADFSRGSLEGARVGSTEITYTPGEKKTRDLEVNIETAGSIGLVFQVLSIASAGETVGGGTINVDIHGGATIGKWAPSSGFIQNVFIPLLSRMGMECKLEVLKHGFYPKGGAHARITFTPPGKTLHGLKLENRGDIKRVDVESIASKQLSKANVAKRQANAFSNAISELSIQEGVHLSPSIVGARNPGSGITAWAITTTGCILSSGTIVGERGLPSETVGKRAASNMLSLIKNSPAATVDQFTSDQLIPFMMLCREHSCFIAPELTSHARTNIDIFREFDKRPFTVREGKNSVRIDFPKS